MYKQKRSATGTTTMKIINELSISVTKLATRATRTAYNGRPRAFTMWTRRESRLQLRRGKRWGLQSPAIYTVPTPGFRGPPGTPGYPPTNDPQRPKLVLPGGSRPELISRQTHLFNRWKAGNLAELITTQDIPQRVLPQESTPGGGSDQRLS